jgi:hypothetical protein
VNEAGTKRPVVCSGFVSPVVMDRDGIGRAWWRVTISLFLARWGPRWSVSSHRTRRPSWPGDVRVVLCSDVNGELDEQTLADALAHLQACYPLLAGRFITKDGRPLVRVDDGRYAGLALGCGTDLDEEINASLTWAQGPLFRITLLRESARTRVVMTLPRAFVDGMSYLAVHRRFWAIYAALCKNDPVPADVVQPVLDRRWTICWPPASPRSSSATSWTRGCDWTPPRPRRSCLHWPR